MAPSRLVRRVPQVSEGEDEGHAGRPSALHEGNRIDALGSPEIAGRREGKVGRGLVFPPRRIDLDRGLRWGIVQHEGDGRCDEESDYDERRRFPPGERARPGGPSRRPLRPCLVYVWGSPRPGHSIDAGLKLLEGPHALHRFPELLEQLAFRIERVTVTPAPGGLLGTVADAGLHHRRVERTIDPSVPSGSRPEWRLPLPRRSWFSASGRCHRLPPHGFPNRTDWSVSRPRRRGAVRCNRFGHTWGPLGHGCVLTAVAFARIGVRNCLSPGTRLFSPAVRATRRESPC